VNQNQVDILWNLVRDAPKVVAADQNEFIVQMIDEFQFMNDMIYRDKIKSENQLAENVARKVSAVPVVFLLIFD